MRERAPDATYAIPNGRKNSERGESLRTALLVSTPRNRRSGVKVRLTRSRRDSAITLTVIVRFAGAQSSFQY